MNTKRSHLRTAVGAVLSAAGALAGQTSPGALDEGRPSVVELLDPATVFLPGDEASAGPRKPTDDSGRWRELTFGDRPLTRWYRAWSRGADGTRVTVCAEADASASALVRELELNPRRHPVLRWTWRSEVVPAGSDPRNREGDDFSARVFVNFRFRSQDAGLWERVRRRIAGATYDGEIPGRALNYVLGHPTDAGYEGPSAYQDDVWVIVLAPGEDWTSVQRNVVEDFQRAFGVEPPEIIGVGVMTDADDTGDVARACYGPLRLHARP